MSNPVDDGKRLFNPSRLKLARIRRKLTLKELAEKMGLSSRIVIEYEKPIAYMNPRQRRSSVRRGSEIPRVLFSGMMLKQSIH